MKAIVFDFDGVLVDSLQANFEIRKIGFKEYGVKISRKDFIDYWVSPTVSRPSQTVHYIEIKRLDIDPEEMKKKQRELYRKVFAKKAKPMPGAIALIKRLKKAGFPIAIVSSNYRKVIEQVIKKIGLGKDFGFIISCEECTSTKPHPEPYLLAAKKLCFAPEEIVAVEDSQTGVESAKAAGLKCIAIPNKFTSGGNFSKADAIVKKLSDINEVLLSKI